MGTSVFQYLSVLIYDVSLHFIQVEYDVSHLQTEGLLLLYNQTQTSQELSEEALRHHVRDVGPGRQRPHRQRVSSSGGREALYPQVPYVHPACLRITGMYATRVHVYLYVVIVELKMLLKMWRLLEMTSTEHDRFLTNIVSSWLSANLSSKGYRWICETPTPISRG